MKVLNPFSIFLLGISINIQNQFINQILKVRKFTMSSIQSLHQSNSLKNFNHLNIIINNRTADHIETIQKEEFSQIQQNQNEPQSNQKYTMQFLCKSFIEKYSKTQSRFDPASLAFEFNAKLRRVYDMTNILEGCGIIQKVEKGIYQWRGLFSYRFNQVQMIKNDWCSLRNISSQLKHLFNVRRQGFNCHELYNILTRGRKTKFNPSTIRRRIYQCCKVFTIVRLIQKVGKYFYNGELKQKDIQNLIKNKMKVQKDGSLNEQYLGEQFESIWKKQLVKDQHQYEKSGIQEFNIGINEYNNSRFQRQRIIKKLISQIKNDEELQNLIKQLSYEYKRKIIYMETQEKTRTQSTISIQFQDQKRTQYEESSKMIPLVHELKIITPVKNLHISNGQFKVQKFIFDERLEENDQSSGKGREDNNLVRQIQKNIIITSVLNSRSSLSISKSSSFCEYLQNQL